MRCIQLKIGWVGSSRKRKPQDGAADWQHHLMHIGALVALPCLLALRCCLGQWMRWCISPHLEHMSRLAAVEAQAGEVDCRVYTPCLSSGCIKHTHGATTPKSAHCPGSARLLNMRAMLFGGLRLVERGKCDCTRGRVYFKGCSD